MQEKTSLDLVDIPTEKMVIVDRQDKGKKKGKRIYIFLAILLILGIIGSIFGGIGYRTYSAMYQKDLALAQVGIQHLQKAETLLKALQDNPLNAQGVSQTRLEFTAALTAFRQVNDDLRSLPAIATAVPVYGARLSAALHVLPIAMQLSQVGIIACDILNLVIARFHDPLSTTSQGISSTDFAVIEKNFRQIKSTLTQTLNQASNLQPSDIQADPRLEKYFPIIQQNLPQLQMGLQTMDQLIPVVPLLLGIGTPTNYLVEILDSTELRPGGGFIGNYGIITVSGGKLAAAHITDTYLLDNPFKALNRSIPFPQEYSWFDLAAGWGLRDSNLDADFPTAARYAEQLYQREGGNIPVQGVVAITPAFIQHALEISGPISVPEYHETVTSQNLIDRIHYYQLGAGKPADDGEAVSSDGRSSARKHFTALLAEHFLSRVRQLPSASLPKLLKLMMSSLRTKDVQLYLNPTAGQNALHSYQLDSAIRPAEGDSIFVVDANISPNKASNQIVTTLQDQVTIDAQGNALHHTVLHYAWTGKGDLYGLETYRDYVRVYVAPDSVLQKQTGWQVRGASMAFGHKVWAGFFTFTHDQTATITLDWMAPNAAKKDARGWHYHYLFQRQASAQWTVHLQVTLPPCATIVQKQGVTANKQTATLAQDLTEDMNVGIDYTC